MGTSPEPEGSDHSLARGREPIEGGSHEPGVCKPRVLLWHARRALAELVFSGRTKFMVARGQVGRVASTRLSLTRVVHSLRVNRA